MDEARSNRRWAVPLAFAIFGVAMVFIGLVPQNLTPSRFSGPDLVLALSIAIVIRRADLLPFWLVACVVLLADFLLARPLGLSAFATVAVVEIARLNRLSFLDMFFLMEWAAVAALIILAAVTQQFLLGFVLLPGHDWITVLWQVSLSILCYPLIVMMSTLILGIRRDAVREARALGAAR